VGLAALAFLLLVVGAYALQGQICVSISGPTASQPPEGLVLEIRFASDGSVGVEDWTGRAMDPGPALIERPLTGRPNDERATDTPG